MPPRFAYWTIIVDGSPTSFRAREREELEPTLRQLQKKSPDAVLRWFSGGKLWDSPDDARLGRAKEREGHIRERENLADEAWRKAIDELREKREKGAAGAAPAVDDDSADLDDDEVRREEAAAPTDEELKGLEEELGGELDDELEVGLEDELEDDAEDEGFRQYPARHPEPPAACDCILALHAFPYPCDRFA